MGSLYNSIYPLVNKIIPLAAAVSLAFLVYTLAVWAVSKFNRREISRLEMFATKETKVDDVIVGSFNHRVRIAFRKYGLETAGNEDTYLWLARLAAGLVLMFLLLIIGLPFVTSLSGLLGGYVFVNGWITHQWNETRTAIEAELPSLLNRLSSALQISPNVPSALEMVAKTLQPDGPLREWTEKTASRMHTVGHSAIDAIRDEAAALSSSLAITAELIGRMWLTGGEGYHKAFDEASDNLESVLDARVMARAKGSSQQRTVNTLTVLVIAMIGFLTHSQALEGITTQPMVQIVYAGIILMIIYGHRAVSDMIDNAV